MLKKSPSGYSPAKRAARNNLGDARNISVHTLSYLKASKVRLHMQIYSPAVLEKKDIEPQPAGEVLTKQFS